MSIVVLKLPEVKRKTEVHPKTCPYCKGVTFQRWGKVRKPVRDNRYRRVQVYRYRCCHCHRSFRHYPAGVDQADQTQRLRKLVAIYWVLGMSLRSVVIALAPFGVKLSHMTVWRDLQEQADRLEKRHHWNPVRVLGLDGVYPLLKGRKRPVLIAVDLGDGRPVAIGQVDEANPQAVRRFLEPLVKRLGVSVIVTDDLASFRQVAEKLGVEHQVCQFHVRRWVGRTLHELRETVPKDWGWVLEEIKALLAELPPEGSKRLYELWKQLPGRQSALDQPRLPLEQLRDLLIRLSEHWRSYRVFDWQKDVPWTNNGTEQVIGRMKMRSRTVRGYKSQLGMWAALLLSGSGVAW
ncbi:MAG TPA: transposase [Anaerolineales bacterium]|nr:transposase [Anaerolineales bacterium]